MRWRYKTKANDLRQILRMARDQNPLPEEACEEVASRSTVSVGPGYEPVPA
jgi:hypothetical protein